MGKNLQIEAELDETVTIQGDAELLTLVWNNLIFNAVKFTGLGQYHGQRTGAGGICRGYSRRHRLRNVP